MEGGFCTPRSANVLAAPERESSSQAGRCGHHEARARHLSISESDAELDKERGHAFRRGKRQADVGMARLTQPRVPASGHRPAGPTLADPDAGGRGREGGLKAWAGNGTANGAVRD